MADEKKKILMNPSEPVAAELASNEPIVAVLQEDFLYFDGRFRHPLKSGSRLAETDYNFEKMLKNGAKLSVIDRRTGESYDLASLM